MPINSRTKGKVGELELANYLKSRGYMGARRGQQYAGGGDSPDVVGLPGYHIECKRVEALNLYDAMQQSIDDAAVDKTPLVVHRKNHKRWLVTIDLDHFLDLLEIANGTDIPGDAATQRDRNVRHDGGVGGATVSDDEAPGLPDDPSRDRSD